MRRRIKEILNTGVIGPVREVHVWADRLGIAGCGLGRKIRQVARILQGIQIVDRFKEEMPVPEHMHWDLWLGPAPERPVPRHLLSGSRWYRWWDFANGTMSDSGSHDNDVPYTVLDIKQPLTVE